MKDTKIIYFILLFVSFILSLFSDWKNFRDLKVLSLLLFFSIITEVLAYTAHLSKYNFYIVYNIYLPIECSLYLYYFSLNIKSPLVKKVSLFSIPIFIIVSVSLSFLFGFNKYPGIQINIEGLLLIVLAITGLFSIEPRLNSKITSIPFFWICVAVLVYYSGIFTYNGLYRYIMEHRSSLGVKLNIYILQISNYILYICFSIAFICSRLTKK